MHKLDIIRISLNQHGPGLRTCSFFLICSPVWVQIDGLRTKKTEEHTCMQETA